MDCETMRDCVLGFVGLGNMGGPMCGRLLEKGYPVWAYDVDSRAIARLQETAAGHAERLHIATSLAELAHAAQVVLLSLPHSGIIEQVVLGERGLAHEMPNGSILIDLSSAKPSSTRRIANELGARGIAMLDAPVSGGVPRAREGTLAVMVGGEQSDFERCRPILAAISSAQFYIGPAGAGHLMKALNNLLSATTLASAVETLHLAERAGIDPALFVDVINASTGRSNSTQVKLPRYILPRTFADGFALGLMNKDVHIALEAADELGVPLAVGSVVAALWEEATAAGLGGEGHTSIYRFIEEWHAPSGVGEASSERTWPALTPTAEPGAAETDASGDLSGELSADEAHERRTAMATESTQDEKQAYVDEMARARGYVLDYHKALAAADFETLRAFNNLIETAYLRPRKLDRKTKELLFIVSLTVMRAGKGHIQSHIRVALDLGVSPEEILEAIELALPEAGVVAFQGGFEAWREVVGVVGIEPTVKAHEGGTGTN